MVAYNSNLITKEENKPSCNSQHISRSIQTTITKTNLDIFQIQLVKNEISLLPAFNFKKDNSLYLLGNGNGTSCLHIKLSIITLLPDKVHSSINCEKHSIFLRASNLETINVLKSLKKGRP
ncbi:hypothetical protein IEQ34_012707 [Dendrobium chrysotoxum]|uniref:Uncharacterized protein n=1 Tax=Dendrobium chrysotoxum TaxID=161865 RepID=A0AAV7GM82_DENCH|nr:hypothetical protein IEQ34_012707 [Dendrobium chrysotoxum]